MTTEEKAEEIKEQPKKFPWAALFVYLAALAGWCVGYYQHGYSVDMADERADRMRDERDEKQERIEVLNRLFFRDGNDEPPRFKATTNDGAAFQTVMACAGFNPERCSSLVIQCGPVKNSPAIIMEGGKLEGYYNYPKGHR